MTRDAIERRIAELEAIPHRLREFEEQAELRSLYARLQAMKQAEARLTRTDSNGL